MKKITLESYEKFSLSEDEIFILKEGKVITKSIAPSGKIISNNTCLKKGGILFNWFSFCNEEDNLELEIEVEALETSILEELKISKKMDERIYRAMLFQLMRKNVIELQYQLYNTKGYILTTLKMYACEKGILSKKSVKPEYFNIGKTQFYKIYKEIKEEGFLMEKRDKIYLDIIKIDEYLLELEE